VCVLLAVAALGAGCFTIHVTSGNEVPADRVAQIHPGQTTKAEVLDWFGAPEDYTDPSGLRRLFADGVAAPEDVLQLPYADVLVFELTRGRGRVMALILYNYIDVHVANDRLVVFFDDHDRVLYYGYRSGADALR
jgi:hypothetical protein